MKLRFSTTQQEHNQHDFNQSFLLSSQNVSKDYRFIKYDVTGNTSLVLQPSQLDQKCSYRKVFLEKQQLVLGSQIDWKKDLSKLKNYIGTKNKIVMRSIKRLYERNFRPDFFKQSDELQNLSFKQFGQEIPMCLYELDHLSHSHVKSFFVTQNYNSDGLYKLCVNQNGRFRIVTVNDMVPVFQQSNEHIWGVEQPWKMIVLKVWACLNGGYNKMLDSHVPFRFLEYFSSSNWKQYNLQKEGIKWFNRIKQSINISYIILQTKSSQQVRKIGLIPGSAAYNIVNLHTNSKGQTQFQVKSRFKHKWKGRLNIVNFNIKFEHNQKTSFKLEKNFFLTKTQFFKIFGSAYLTSLSKALNHVTDCFKIEIPRKCKNAIYFSFEIKNKDFFDFSFIQSYQNKITLENQESIRKISDYSQKSAVKIQNQQKQNRYLKLKYMLIRKINNQKGVFESKIKRQSKIIQSKLTSYTKYEAYEVNYLQGQNKGQAHFLMMEPGEYYFRLKPQCVDKDTIFYLNYCSREKLKFEKVELDAAQKRQIFTNSIFSLLPGCVKFKTKNLMIYSGDKFNEMGYGFLVLQNITEAEKEHNVLFSIDLQKLEMEGFKIKGGNYKNKQQQGKISFQVKPNQYLPIIFKRTQNNMEKNYFWPPQSIEIFNATDLVKISQSKI